MASHALSRRGFLGHVGGAYAATFIAAPVVSAELAHLIDCHRRLWDAWGQALVAQDDDPTEAGEAAAEALYGSVDEAMTALMTFRPETIEEARARIGYLIEEGGPWVFNVATSEHLDMLFRSMLPVRA